MVGDQQLKIGFITDEGFPSGMATTNRILSLAIGLTELGHLVTIFCVRPTEKTNTPINKDILGIHKGVRYIYTAGTVIWPEKLLNKLYVTVIGFLGFFKYFKLENKNAHFDSVISTTSPLVFNYFFTRYLKRNKAIPLLAIDEYPHVVRNKTKYPKWFAGFYLKFFYRFFDGLVIMTKPLMNFYKELVRVNAKLQHIPMTVEIERFVNNSDSPPINDDYIAYCGNLGQNQKDGVPILIEAFSMIKKDFKNIKLLIIGGTNPSDEERVILELKELSRNLDVGDDVIFTGKVHRDEMPKYLCNAKLLALARPDSIQAQGGFPTKLGEYLATGKPVVVTKVGEIPDYLEDGVSAYLTEPDSARFFAEKLNIALNDYNNSMKIGKEGQRLALSVFNSRVQAKVLANYLADIKVKKDL